jgi:hypothetical protein
MSYNLFLDDFRDTRMAFISTRDKRYVNMNWIIVENYNQFISYIIKNGVPTLVSFDHDIGFEHYDLKGCTKFSSWGEYYVSTDREMTGYDCAVWLCEYCLKNNKKFPEYIIHSSNMVGSANIDGYIKNFLKYYPELK